MQDRRVLRKRRREMLTREEIRDAVARVLAVSGSRNLTMDRVAQEAGVAKGTLYLYYKTKRDMLESTIEHTIAPLVEESDRLMDSDLAPCEKLARFVALNFMFFERRREFFRVLLLEKDEVQREPRRKRTSHYRRVLERVSDVVGVGMSSGEFRPMDAEKVATVLMESMIAMIQFRLRSEAPGLVRDDVILVLDLFFGGVGLGEIEFSGVLERVSEHSVRGGTWIGEEVSDGI